MSALREHSLSSAYESVVSKASFRRPQHDAFERFHQLMRAVGRDVSSMTQREVADRLSDLGFAADDPADLYFDLATGVGKTCLLGGILVYLARARQTQNCLILAPRVAILEKLKRESDPTSPKYLFIDRSLITNPNICFRSDILSFEPDVTRLNVFILSPQTITGDDRRFATAGDFGPAIRDYLRQAEDLVVFSDEAHHVGHGGFGAWRQAVMGLTPKLHLGFTATVPKGSERKVLYSYPLNTCLTEGKYTKAVKLWVEPKPPDIGDDEWDHQTIDFALKRIEAKQAAIAEFRALRPEFPDVNPVLLVAAKDIAHAERIGLWLEKYRDLEADENSCRAFWQKVVECCFRHRAGNWTIGFYRPTRQSREGCGKCFPALRGVGCNKCLGHRASEGPGVFYQCNSNYRTRSEAAHGEARRRRRN